MGVGSLPPPFEQERVAEVYGSRVAGGRSDSQ